MNIKAIHYNNSLLYLAALENNVDLVNTLFKKGYPKSINDLTRAEKKNANQDDLDKISVSYHNATSLLITELLKNPSSFQMLSKYVKLIVDHNKANQMFKTYRALCGQAFYMGNIQGFELFSDIIGKEVLCDQHSLLFYIHEARKNKNFSKKIRKELTTYIENLGLDWSKANTSLTYWANKNRTQEDFRFFYRRRKQGLNNSENAKDVLKKELHNCIESFLKQSFDFEQNLNNPVLDYIANTYELKTENPYEGYFLILRKAYKVSKYFNVDESLLQAYFFKIFRKHPDMIKYLKRSIVKIPELNSIIDKINLKAQLSNNLYSRKVIKTINKI